MICTRSSSGKHIAFAKWTIYPGKAISNVFWFDLDELNLSSTELPEIALHWLGFSPDNELLAISGNSPTSGEYLFFLLDMDRGEIQTLPIPENFNRVEWSPDGSQILVLEEAWSSFDADPERTIKIYSAIDGQFVDQIEVKDVPYDLNTLRIPFGGDEVEFKLGIQDISSCAAPPRN